MKFNKIIYETERTIRQIESEHKEELISNNDLKEILKILKEREQVLLLEKRLKEIFLSSNEVNNSEKEVFEDTDIKLIKEYIRKSNIIVERLNKLLL